MSVKPVAWAATCNGTFGKDWIWPAEYGGKEHAEGFCERMTESETGLDNMGWKWTVVPVYDAPAPELAEVLEILTAACEKEFISPVTEHGEVPCLGEVPCADEDSVMGGLDGESPITFGMIRTARKLLARITPK